MASAQLLYGLTLLVGGLPGLGTAPAANESTTTNVDASFFERGVQIQMESRQPGDVVDGVLERDTGRDQEEGPPGGNSQPPNDRTLDDDGVLESNPNRPGEESSLYCSEGIGLLDASCQSLISALPGNVGCIAGGMGGRAFGDSYAPICLDDTPPPLEEAPVVEAAIPPSEDEGPDLEQILEEIPGIVTEEFSSLPIEGGEVRFEEDLLGFGYVDRHTNVFVDVEQQTFQEVMLGLEVEIRAVPVAYQFDYGDGTTLDTANPGQPIGGRESVATDLETPTSHVYQDTGVYDVNVTTTFTGEYRIAGGSWVPIADSASIAAAPGEADIWRTQARHVSGECEDRNQWGCNGPFIMDEGDQPPQIFSEQYDDAGNWLGP